MLLQSVLLSGLITALIFSTIGVGFATFWPDPQVSRERSSWDQFNTVVKSWVGGHFGYAWFDYGYFGSGRQADSNYGSSVEGNLWYWWVVDYVTYQSGSTPQNAIYGQTNEVDASYLYVRTMSWFSKPGYEDWQIENYVEMLWSEEYDP